MTDPSFDPSFDIEKSYELCEDLSLRRHIPAILREQARYQLYFHLGSAPALFPSWHSHRLSFVAPSGWMQMNPSITNINGELRVALRCCNYTVDWRGPSTIEGTPYFSRTVLLYIDPDTFADTPIAEICLNPASDCFKPGVPGGFEDLRIFPYHGSLWGSFVRCTQNPEGWPEMWLARLETKSDYIELENPRQLRAPTIYRQPEKNWMPFIDDSSRLSPHFIYKCDPTTILVGSRKISETTPLIDVTNLRGSTQAIPFNDGWLALTHSLIMHKGYPKYSHRFIWLSADYKLSEISPAFILPTQFESEIQGGYQYIMGLTLHPDTKRLIISYSIGECQAWLATLSTADVSRNLRWIRD